MWSVLRIRLVLAAIGATVFFFGIRAESDRTRWIGVAFVGAAWLGRFYRPRREESNRQGPSI
jgi:hypothetical protein